MSLSYPLFAHPIYAGYGVDNANRPYSTMQGGPGNPKPLKPEGRAPEGRARRPRITVLWRKRSLRVHVATFAAECRKGVRA